MADCVHTLRKCVEVCPVTGPGGVNAERAPSSAHQSISSRPAMDRKPPQVGKLLRAHRRVHQACDYGVNPRFMLGWRESRWRGTRTSRPARRARRRRVPQMARDVSHISQMQLDDELLARLGQKSSSNIGAGEAAGFRVLHGCNVLRTRTSRSCPGRHGHARTTYQVLGGPSHCAAGEIRTGDVATPAASPRAPWTSSRAASRPGGVVVSELPWFAVHRDDVADGGKDPAVETVRDDAVHAVPAGISTACGPLLRTRVPMRIALHRHPASRALSKRGEDILRAFRAWQLVDLHQPRRHDEHYFPRAPPIAASCRRTTRRRGAGRCRRAGSALSRGTIASSGAHERDYPFRIMNLLEIVGAAWAWPATITSSGSRSCKTSTHRRHCRDLIAQHGSTWVDHARVDHGDAGGASRCR